MASKFIEGTMAAQNLVSAPIHVAPEERFITQLSESVATLVALVDIEWIMTSLAMDPHRPNDADSRWTLLKQVSMTSAAQTVVSDIGSGWFRIKILTGNYTSGTLGYKNNKARQNSS